jgi:hypothetical protein
MQVSKITSVLLSNNGLLNEGEEGSQGTELQVDCRGHPINLDYNADEVGADYENLILVGVWLAVKENGLALYNALSWLQLPKNENDDSKFIIHADIVTLCENFLQMLF